MCIRVRIRVARCESRARSSSVASDCSTASASASASASALKKGYLLTWLPPRSTFSSCGTRESELLSPSPFCFATSSHSSNEMGRRIWLWLADDASNSWVSTLVVTVGSGCGDASGAAYAVVERSALVMRVRKFYQRRSNASAAGSLAPAAPP